MGPDPYAATNPRRALMQREIDAGTVAPMAPAAAASAPPVEFFKPRTADQRAGDRTKLAEALKRRQ